MFGHRKVHVTAVSPDANLNFDATDVRHIVKSGHYLALNPLAGARANNLVRLDRRPDLVLRWERAGLKESLPGLPSDALELIDHTLWFEAELGHLARLGITALRHQTFVASGSALGEVATLFTVTEHVPGLEPMFRMPDIKDTTLPFPDTLKNRQRAIAFGNAISEYLVSSLSSDRNPVFDVEEPHEYADLERDGSIATLFDLDHGVMPIEDIVEARLRLEHLIKLSKTN